MLVPSWWSLILFVHLACISVWIGGAIYAAFVLTPSLTLLDGTQRVSVHLQTLKRFFLVLWHVIPLTLLSGWSMIFHMGGFTHLIWPINVMQILGLLMAVLFLLLFFGPYQKIRRAIRPRPELFSNIRRIVIMNIFIGLITILVASFAHPL